MSPITTHILDTAAGKPAAGVTVKLEIANGSSWQLIGEGVTNDDGRVADLLGDSHKLEKANYRITFDTKSYYKAENRKSFYPEASIVFEIEAPEEHYHVPLLLSGFGYSTYRGS